MSATRLLSRWYVHYKKLLHFLRQFYVHGSVHHESLSITVQQDATIYSFYYISAGCCTCFGWYTHPSSGAHSNCNYIIWHCLNRICYRPLTWRSPPRQWTVANTVRPVPEVVITVWACSWWWMWVSSETCRAVLRNLIKLYIVASCWTVIDIDFWDTFNVISFKKNDDEQLLVRNMSRII